MDYEEKHWILVNICGRAGDSEPPTPPQKKHISKIAELPSEQKR
jgi:hypothetical protein